MEKEPKVSPELQEVEKLVIDGVANAIKQGHIEKEHGELLIQTYRDAVRNKIAPGTEAEPGAVPQEDTSNTID